MSTKLTHLEKVRDELNEKCRKARNTHRANSRIVKAAIDALNEAERAVSAEARKK